MWTSILKNDPRFSDRDKSILVRTTFWLWNVFSIPTILNDRQNRHPEKWRSLHCCWFHQTKSREIVRIRLKLSESGQFISFKTGNFVGHFRTNRNDEIHESLNSSDCRKGNGSSWFDLNRPDQTKFKVIPIRTFVPAGPFCQNWRPKDFSCHNHLFRPFSDNKILN